MFIAIKSKKDCSEALEAARRYSPNIEIVDEKTLVFDLTGSRVKDAPKISRQLREKFASVAVSDNLAAALLAVRWGRDGSAGVRGGGSAGKEKFQVSSSKFQVRKIDGDKNQTSSSEQTLNSEPGTLNTLSTQYSVPSTLSALPIAAIAQRADFLELMDSWAVHDLGSFVRLPADEMVARFGPEIVEMQRQARGEAFRAVGWNVKEDKFFWAKDLEGAIETIEPLNFVLSKGVEQIFQNLDYVGLSTQSVKITLRGHEREKIYRIRLVFPTKNQKVWIRQIVTKIELDTPGFNIEGVEIEFRSTKPRIVQNNLYSGTILEPENLNLIVSKLKKVVGLEKIGLPKLRDSWSDTFYMTPALSPLIEEKEPEFQVSSSRFQVGEEDRSRNTRKERKREEEVSGSRFQVSGSGIKGSRFQVPGSRFQVQVSGSGRSFRFQVSGFKFE